MMIYTDIMQNLDIPRIVNRRNQDPFVSHRQSGCRQLHIGTDNLAVISKLLLEVFQ